MKAGQPGRNNKMFDTGSILNHLTKDLQDDNITVRANCIDKISLISKCIGPGATTNALFPLLSRHVFDQGDNTKFSKSCAEEDIANVAKAMNGEFFQNAGGENNCKLQLEFLCKVMGHEETVVREAAAKSFCECVDRMSEEFAHTTILPIFGRLCDSDLFPGKVSAAIVAPSLFSKLADEASKNEMLDRFKKLVRDSSRLVQLQAFKELPAMVENSDFKFRDHYLYIMKLLDAEIVQNRSKLLLVKVALTMLKKYPENFEDDIALPWFEMAGKSLSWRMRVEFINALPEICEVYTKQDRRHVCSQNLYPLCISTLTDSEPQVREVALKKLVDCVPYFKVDDTLLEALKTLSEDENQSVKEMFAKTVIRIFAAAQPQMEVAALEQIVKNIVKTETDGSVIMNLCECFGDLVGLTMDIPQYSDLPLQFVPWFEHTKWRIRYAMVSNMSQVCSHYTHTEFDKSDYKDMFLKAFTDAAFEVRNEACRQLPKIAESLDEAYVFDTLILPVLHNNRTAHVYHYRLVAFMLISAFAESDMPAEKFVDYFGESLVAGLKDKVVNVQIKAFQCAHLAADKLKEVSGENLNDVRVACDIAVEQTKQDPDVAYFAKEALNLLGGV